MKYRVINEKVVEETRWFGEPLLWVLVNCPELPDSLHFRKWVNQHGRSVYAGIAGEDITLFVERWKLLKSTESANG